MIPDFPHNIRIRLARLNFFLLCPDVAKSLPCWLSQFSFSTGRQDATKKNSKGPILFLYYEESLVSSNLNSELFRFHCVRPNLSTAQFVCNVCFLDIKSTQWSRYFCDTTITISQEILIKPNMEG